MQLVLSEASEAKRWVEELFLIVALGVTNARVDQLPWAEATAKK
jgi:hypothetical protein